ncbi:hypothetical protein [Haemophilus influenzae]|uniref:hypothetical protein n=1 Tax=Haemophilus influenzae TaxID=727 RepID=UPI003BFA77EE
MVQSQRRGPEGSQISLVLGGVKKKGFLFYFRKIQGGNFAGKFSSGNHFCGLVITVKTSHHLKFVRKAGEMVATPKN